MKVIKLFFLIIVVLSQNACNNQEKEREVNDKKGNKIQSTSINEIESICRFAKSEIQRYYRITKQKKEFENTKYLNVISDIIFQLDRNCDLQMVKNIFVKYLNSPEFIRASKKLNLDCLLYTSPSPRDS